MFLCSEEGKPSLTDPELRDNGQVMMHSINLV